ncbi:NDP-sugar synthase [Amycolatopsis magusensis]|uniref:NDP-sugar synthase n=1 Tax=Amycolatopsis magusensis TaxID=882444 RepID=UPI0037944293
MVSVIVLCGGRGTRLGNLGRHRQKTMLPVWGAPVLERVLTQLCPAVPHPAPVVLLTGHRGEQVHDAVPAWRRRIDPRIQATAEMSPGAAGVLEVASRLPAPVLVVAGNVLLDYGTLLPHVLRQWGSDGRAVVAGSRTWRTSHHHTLTAENTTITAWHRAPDRAAGQFEVVDTYLLTSDILDTMRTQAISHTRALSRHVALRQVAFCEFSGDWLHLETLADLAVAPSRKDLLCPRAPPLSW